MENKQDGTDVAGYTLGEAREILRGAGRVISEIKVTAPPRHPTREYAEHYRVVRVEAAEDGSVHLLVCKPL